MQYLDIGRTGFEQQLFELSFNCCFCCLVKLFDDLQRFKFVISFENMHFSILLGEFLLNIENSDLNCLGSYFCFKYSSF